MQTEQELCNINSVQMKFFRLFISLSRKINFPKAISADQNVSEMPIPLLSTRLTDLLVGCQGLISVNPKSVPVEYERIITVSNL